MIEEMTDHIPASCELLALGEPTHQEPAFGRVRNEIFKHLLDHGFRSIALETDRVAALAVNDFVQHGVGTLDDVMRRGFSHAFGNLDPNRELVAWMREYNRDQPSGAKLSFHGFDAPMENLSAPSPRGYLAYAAEYLGMELGLAEMAGDDVEWSRSEAVLDPAMSPGASPQSERLRVIADDLMTQLYARAPERITATSVEAWHAARIHVAAGRDLLRYHRQCAHPLEPDARMSGLLACRDALMAQNLLDIRRLEADRGPTLVFAHNLHLQRQVSGWAMSDTSAGTDASWYGAGSIVAALVGNSYTVIAGSLGRSTVLGLGDPAAGSYEAQLHAGAEPWAVTPAYALAEPTTVRGDVKPEMGYFPLSPATVAGVDFVVHVRG